MESYIVAYCSVTSRLDLAGTWNVRLATCFSSCTPRPRQRSPTGRSALIRPLDLTCDSGADLGCTGMDAAAPRGRPDGVDRSPIALDPCRFARGVPHDSRVAIDRRSRSALSARRRCPHDSRVADRSPIPLGPLSARRRRPARHRLDGSIAEPARPSVGWRRRDCRHNPEAHHYIEAALSASSSRQVGR